MPTLGFVPPAIGSLRRCQSRSAQSRHLFEFCTLCGEIGGHCVFGFDCLVRPPLLQGARLALLFGFDLDLSRSRFSHHGDLPAA
jgi:hypothetical protein